MTLSSQTGIMMTFRDSPSTNNIHMDQRIFGFAGKNGIQRAGKFQKVNFQRVGQTRWPVVPSAR